MPRLQLHAQCFNQLMQMTFTELMAKEIGTWKRWAKLEGVMDASFCLLQQSMHGQPPPKRKLSRSLTSTNILNGMLLPLPGRLSPVSSCSGQMVARRLSTVVGLQGRLTRSTTISIAPTTVPPAIRKRACTQALPLPRGMMRGRSRRSLVVPLDNPESESSCSAPSEEERGSRWANAPRTSRRGAQARPRGATLWLQRSHECSTSG